MYCSKDFICSTSFKEHEVMYSIHKHFSCKKCIKAFDCSMILKEHYVLHCTYKTFACKEHDVIYSRLIEFSCQQSSKNFGWSRNLREHELIQSIDNYFYLEFGPSVFGTSSRVFSVIIILTVRSFGSGC